MSNNYTNLLLALLEADNHKLTIKSTVTPSALRKGLNKAIVEFNTMQSMLNLEEITLTNINITTVEDKVTIALYDEDDTSTPRAGNMNKFSFEVVVEDSSPPLEKDSGHDSN